jgi:hypothetical protein
MKQIVMGVIIGVMTHINVAAQTEVCDVNGQGQLACYKTAYAENFKVCKNNKGYHICGETPNYYNSTHPGFTVPDATTKPCVVADGREQATAENAEQGDLAAAPTAPTSQSYPADYLAGNVGSTIMDNYPARHYIKVADEDVPAMCRAPYEGLPSPQDDGPGRNNARNINVSNPAPLPPIQGRPEE